MEQVINRAVVLAAGHGSRLGGVDEAPKPLRKVGGVPLLVRILRTLQGEGVREAVVVLGHRGDEIKHALLNEPSLVLRLKFVRNLEYDKSNGVSLLAAQRFIDEPCLLTMADHLCAPELVRRLQSMVLPSGCCALAVDHEIDRCFDIDDATKVKLEGRHIAKIGKELPHYDVLDTGVFRIGSALVEKLEEIYCTLGDCSLSDGVGALAAEGRMLACDIGDAQWIDVDTPAAAARAEVMLHMFGDYLGGRPETSDQMIPEALEIFPLSWVRAV